MQTTKNYSNLQIAKLFRSVAAALSLSEGDNKFRIIAYQRAADAIEHASSEVKDLWDDGKLSSLAGIGPAMSDHLDELFKTGKVRHFENVLKPFPPAIFELMEVPGIGPKTAYKLCTSLGISKAHNCLSLLEKAARKGHIRSLEGFGIESEADILRGIVEFKGRTKRLLLPTAQEVADDVIAWLSKSQYTVKAYPLGSLRRQVSTVGDIDIAVATNNPQATIDHFTQYPKKSRVLEAGDKSASLILPNEYQVDLMVQPPKSFGSLLQHFTGSKHHNVALRELALKKGLSLSEYGIKTKSGLKTFPDEKDFYKYLGLEWVPPELREARGEIDAAKNGTLPKLVTLEDIKGDLQIHSNINVEPSHDLGQSSPAEIANIAQKLKYQYIGLTEHNPSVSRHTPSQVLDIIKRKTEIIRQVSGPIHVFNGLEIDIQPNGDLALPETALDLLDYACVSIHSSFRLNRKEMTNRVLAALSHPKVKFFAHPTGRLLGEREGVELDWDRIFDFCLTHGKWLEIDGWPNRLDLPDALVHEAVKMKVKLIIDTDSHAASQMVYMKYGVSVARRGWATAGDIVNTLPLNEFSKLLKGGE
jgi:DNA polymerase (family 10)